jgi:hypothetical protein
MTTASTTKLVKEDGVTPFDSFDAGSGRVALKKAGDPGITFDAPAQDYIDHSADLWNVNYPSVYLPGPAPSAVSVTRTAQSELSESSTWALTVSAPADLGVTVPAEITVPAGGSASFSIGIDKSALGPGQARHARLELRHKSYLASLPITAVGVSPLPNLVVTAVTASSPVPAGGLISISQTFMNAGTAAAGPFRTAFWISTDAVFASDDTFLAVCDIAGLAAGASATCSDTIFFVPRSPVPPGNYRMLALIDSESMVLEGNEGDNVTATAGTFNVCPGQCLFSACACSQTSPVNEDLTSCFPETIDTWVFDVGAGESIDIRADTVDAGTAADLCISGSCASGDTFFADDNVACTFPPPSFACPQSVFVASGAGQCTVQVTLCSAACANPATANYQLRVKHDGVDAAVALVVDDAD